MTSLYLQFSHCCRNDFDGFSTRCFKDRNRLSIKIYDFLKENFSITNLWTITKWFWKSHQLFILWNEFTQIKFRSPFMWVMSSFNNCGSVEWTQMMSKLNFKGWASFHRVQLFCFLNSQMMSRARFISIIVTSWETNSQPEGKVPQKMFWYISQQQWKGVVKGEDIESKDLNLI